MAHNYRDLAFSNSPARGSTSTSNGFGSGSGSGSGSGGTKRENITAEMFATRASELGMVHMGEGGEGGGGDAGFSWIVYKSFTDALPEPWEEAEDEDGQRYFYNNETEVSGGVASGGVKEWESDVVTSEGVGSDGVRRTTALCYCITSILRYIYSTTTLLVYCTCTCTLLIVHVCVCVCVASWSTGRHMGSPRSGEISCSVPHQ
jgi:hypothetical protein